MSAIKSNLTIDVCKTQKIPLSESLNVGIIGLGLIGASMGRSLVKRTTHKVFGRDIVEGVMDDAEHVKAIHAPLTDNDFNHLDVLIFAVNPSVTMRLLPEIVPLLKDGCIVTDVGGVKRGVIGVMDLLHKQYPNLHFVGAHPMAGKEFSGLKHSIPTLFDGATILTTHVHANDVSAGKLHTLFNAMGFGEIKEVTSTEHDRMIAYTSQACHAVSAAFCLHPLSGNHKGFSAGSFRDLTRVAKLEASMWSELFCENSDYLAPILEDIIKEISNLKCAIQQKDTVAVHEILTKANAQKELIIQ